MAIRNPSRRKRRKSALVRYAIEPLERRTLLSMVMWTGNAGDNQWTTPGNWSTNALPTGSDDVTINLAGNPTIQLSSPSNEQSIQSLTTSDPLTIAGGFLHVGTTMQISANMTVENGGEAWGADVYIGTSAGAGSVTLTGNGSTLFATSQLFVGNASGSGTLSVSGGGLAESPDAFIGNGGVGIVTVTGSGSEFYPNTKLEVGYGSSGTLAVSGGGLARSPSVYIGNGGTGVFTVDGGGSKVIISDLNVGYAGAGTFSLSNGAKAMNVGTVHVGANAGSGNVTVTGSGSVLAAISNVYIAEGGSSGSVAVTGSGSMLWAGADLYVGGNNSNSGTLSLSGGGQATSPSVLIGFNAGIGGAGSGSVTVTGSGSTLTASTQVLVFSGTLSLNDGGQATSPDVTFQGGAGAVDGSGSTLFSSHYMLVNGSPGFVALSLSNGGQVRGSEIGIGVNGSGGAMVTGSGSILYATTFLQVGFGAVGSGTLNLSDGGQAQVISGGYTAISDNGGTGTLMLRAAGATDGGAVILGANSFLGYNLNSPNASAGAGGNDLLNAASLTLGTGLTLDVNPGALFGAGVYHLIHYTGTLSDNSGSFSGWSVNGGNGPATFSIDTIHQYINVTFAVGLILTTPATSTSVNEGVNFAIDWTGGNSTDSVQLWAEGGPDNAWTELTTGVPESNGSFTWNTTGVAHGWYHFLAWDISNAGNVYSARSPDFLHVVAPAALAPNISLTNPPLASDAVGQGNTYTLNFTATNGANDTNPVFVQLWVYSGNTGLWSELPNANYLPAAQGHYDLNTSGMTPGWYSFAAHATNGDQWSYAASPGWLHVTVPAPTIAFTTPTSGQSVAAGGTFNLNWNITGLSSSDLANSIVQIWAQHLVNGSAVWAEIAASVNAANGTFAWSVPTSPGAGTYYAFNIYLNDGNMWWAQASPNWLQVT